MSHAGTTPALGGKSESEPTASAGRRAQCWLHAGDEYEIGVTAMPWCFYAQPTNEEAARLIRTFDDINGAIRFMDERILLLEKQGYTVQSTDEPNQWLVTRREDPPIRMWIEYREQE